MHLHPERSEKHFTASDTVRDVIVGMSDGLTEPFALAAGISGAIAIESVQESAYFARWPLEPSAVQITLYNSSMVITRKIRKVGNSLMIPLPPETIAESGFKAGMEVAIGSRPGHVDLDPAGIPDNWLVEFTARFTERYREDLAELADL